MDNILGALSRLVVARPWVTLFVLLVVTVALGAGTGLRVPPAETASALPEGSAITQAMTEIEDLFGESGDVRVITLLFRGNALTPDALAQMDALLNDIANDPAVSDLLAPVDPIVAPSLLVMAALQVDSLGAVTQDQINSAQTVPGIGEALSVMTGTDTDGTPVAIGTVRLRNTDDDRLVDAERRVYDLAVENEGPLDVSSVSYTVIEDESREATETGMVPLVGLAFLLIAVLLLLFMRSISDLLLTLLGLFIALIWIIGAEGLLGPEGLGLVGPPNALTAMVPIIMIGLTVDYAIQTVSHYREQRVAGEAVVRAVQTGLRNVTIPLVLAAVTTIVSLLAGLFSPINIIGDFGIIAGLGVGMSLIVMLMLLPAGRTILDRRREARGTLRPARPISTALPGVQGMAEGLGREVTRAPVPYFLIVAVATIALGVAATGLKAEFSIRDLLPSDGTVMADINTLDAAIGGSTEIVSVLVRAEATDTRTLLNLQDFTTAFENETLQPSAAAGPIRTSYELLLRDWIDDSGEPGDKYDPELAALFNQATADVELDARQMQEILDRLEAQDPAITHVLVNNPDGIDAFLLQFAAFTGDPEASRALQEDIDRLWFGDDDAITATSETIISFAVTDAIRDRQTESIGTTVAVALGVLAIFFWLTVRQPLLAIIAVGPTFLVLISVLGTMALLDIPYTIITSIITALSIGIGVDYTIHVIHRYREEYGRRRDPEQAAVRTLATTGSALLGSALTTGLGIGVLIASPLQASQQFAITAAITILYSLIVSILVVPPAMTIWGAYQNVRLRSNLQRMAEDLDSEIEAVYQRQERGE
ncbi:MAG: MMPL family transporter [Chloroflexi bacterium]|nr:MMPL family transporter [Chloroflexota bacterium]